EISKVHGDEERFQAQVYFQGKLLGEGKGRSMKLAEQAAAKIGFGLLRTQLDEDTSQDDASV
ncbi:MAG: putative dsRNA-binding protein, partial [Cyanobacteria bacterium P01_A01_bin.116]